MKLRKVISFGFVLTSLHFFLVTFGQIYEVSCDVQQSEAYRWGTNFAYFVAALLVGIPPPITIRLPPGAGTAVGTSVTALLRFLWPMFIGYNDHCIEDAIKAMTVKMTKMTDLQVNNVTLEEIKRWFDGHADTAKKVYEWIPVINSAQDEMTRRDASEEFLKDLNYLYFSANEARDSFLQGSIGQPSSFLYIRELAFLQFGVAAEIIANKYTPAVVRQKFLNDYRKDVEYYWQAGHLSVEKLIRCQPNDKIGKARIAMSRHLMPLYNFAYKFITNNESAVYNREAVYKPVVSGDFVAFRLNDGSLADFEDVFRMSIRVIPSPATPKNKGCPKCGWDLFDGRYSPVKGGVGQSAVCRQHIFEIANTQALGTPIRTCETVALTYRVSGSPVVASLPSPKTPLFVVAVYNATVNDLLPCGRVVLDRDHILLAPTASWTSNAKKVDSILLKAEQF